MEFNLTSSDEIIARVMRDFKLSNINWKASAYDWIADAMQAINAWYSFETKERLWRIENHKAKFPADLIELFEVSYKGCELPLGKNNSGLSCKTRTCNDVKSDLLNYEKVRELNAILQYILDLESGLQTPDIEDQIASLKAQAKQYTIPYAANPYSNCGVEYYNLGPGYIQTSFETGYIKLKYTGAVSDDKGFPMIPDVYEFKEGIAWYITSRILMSGTQHPIFTYDFADAKWEHFMRAARNKIKMPSLARMQRLVEMWTSPVYCREAYYCDDSNVSTTMVIVPVNGTEGECTDDNIVDGGYADTQISNTVDGEDNG